MFFKVRLILLHTICISMVLILGKLILDPTAGKRSFADFKFPDALPLAGWKLVASQLLIDRALATAEYDRVNAGRLYHYRQNAISLQVEVRYVLNTNGDVSRLLQQTSVEPISKMQQIQTISGFYNSFTTSDALHLTSCVNPRGNSTVTSTQFLQNRYAYDLQMNHLLAWATGQENLIDQRCLWLHLSTPLHVNPHDQALALLESAWHNLTLWGQTQFPQP